MQPDTIHKLFQEPNFCDYLNLNTMRSREAVAHYSRISGLKPAERVAFDLLASRVQDRAILDVGMGGGRTINGLQAISQDYVGIDYAEEMVQSCRKQYPGLDFRHADARDLSQFADNSFALIVFSCEGISMVDHLGRLKVLAEIRRVLKSDGYFVFSTMNQESPYMSRPFQFPDFESTLNPLRMFVRSWRFVSQLLLRLKNRYQNKQQDLHTEEFSIINDEYHNYSTMIYYISLQQQKKQLAASGYDPESIVALDLAGKVIGDKTEDDTLTFIVQKQ